MLVKAIKLGYFGHKRRKEGDEFMLSDEKEYSDKWMEKADVKKGKSKKKSKEVFEDSPEDKFEDMPKSDDVI